ncbi:hypothetical protein [Actinoalloteichus sp. GBA129-24]|uniref:hypothetical protein n=1 Tax=Actinoalloteichus sp. GBA129-24 TaxID=1612551 RepID=UPI00095069E0|nr:hypothetical protein [Actinoalloteichus sp. GBA129-24]APU22557.1 hypothetical protein UA75_22875 [Actinoalloteichus sp. GBA129-24]
MSFDGLRNVGDYFSPHYLTAVLPRTMKERAKDRAGKEKLGEFTAARDGLRGLREPFFQARAELADVAESNYQLAAASPAWRRTLQLLHDRVSTALGFTVERHDLVVRNGDAETQVPVLHADRGVVVIECGWALNVDAAFEADGGGALLTPVETNDGVKRQEETGSGLARFLFRTEDPPRYVLILAGAVLVLADRYTWGEGRYLATNLDTVLGRMDTSTVGELHTVAELFSAASLHAPDAGGDSPLAELVGESNQHAAGVSPELRAGLQRSVELIANEVLDRLREADVHPQDVEALTDLGRTLRDEALRYLYRILFLLYAEARPELGILPADYPEYGEGYGLARLGELATHPIVDDVDREGFHLYESLDLLCSLVNTGYRSRSMGEAADRSEGEGLRFEALNSDLFLPSRVTLIGRIRHPDWEADDPTGPPEYLDTRLRNGVLHAVLRLLMLTKGRGRGERTGFISYAQLGINQLGAVYEGLMSYTGFIAEEDLFEVAKKGDAEGGSWLIPVSAADQFPNEVFVRWVDQDPDRAETFRAHYPAGSFVYRLAGRDRQTSASYYTPESLTRATVSLALRQRITEHPGELPARDLLTWRICEPALGSGAFLNEAINQLAAEYLRRRGDELRGQGRSIPPEEYEEELRKVKAHLALHNSYGVDLNRTAVELAEVSIWLNVMHPGLAAPWFGLHLRRGNSLIGAGRRCYVGEDLTSGRWAATKDPAVPLDVPLHRSLPAGAVHHFLLPAIGWGAVAGESEAKALAPGKSAALNTWRKAMRHWPSAGRTKRLNRLRRLADQVEMLWRVVIRRLKLSEREISRDIAIWGAEDLPRPVETVPRQQIYDDLHAVGSPYWRLKKLMDVWCALWFWPPGKADLLTGESPRYARSEQLAEQSRSIGALGVRAAPAAAAQGDSAAPSPVVAAASPAWQYTEQLAMNVGGRGEQIDLFSSEASVPAMDIMKPRGTTSKKDRTKPTRRTVIPLTDIDDWLDFAESMLGVRPLEGLFEETELLAVLAEEEKEIPLLTGMESWADIRQRYLWLGDAEEIADRQGFFHWELDFAQVFASPAGGFDIQVGNPPWVRPRWDEGGVLAELDPWFALAEKPTATAWRDRKTELLSAEKHRVLFYLAELVNQVGNSSFLSSRPTYRLLTGTQPDLYRAFMIRTWANRGDHGAVGLLHPDTHFTGKNESALRAAAYRRLRVHGDFVNAGNRFFPPPVNRSSHFGLHVYGGEQDEIGFQHLSWLLRATVLTDSLAPGAADDETMIGVREDGGWNERPHASRVISVDRATLAEWHRVQGGSSAEVEETALLYPVSRKEEEAIRSLGRNEHRLAGWDLRISRGFDESVARKRGVIETWVGQPESWSDVILKGPQLGVATPFFKQPPNTGTGARPQDLTVLPTDAVPGTSYRTARPADAEWDRWVDHRILAGLWADPAEVAAARRLVSEHRRVSPDKVQEDEIDAVLRDKARRPYVDFFRVAWREMVPSDTERSLFAALIPPGPAHIHAVRSMALPDNRGTALTAGFWASLPVDYLLRVTGTEHLDVRNVRRMPAPSPTHPLAAPLLLRTLRLNCLTEAYAPLWAELFDDCWNADAWAADWPGLPPLAAVGPEWTPETPLRTERARRAALVEIDALVAVWLGLSADHLQTIYRSRFPVLSDYEDDMYFDAAGRKLAGNWNAYGHGQTKEHWQAFTAHRLAAEEWAAAEEKQRESLPPVPPPPVGYTAPFVKAERVGEMRQAHQVFAARLDAADDGGRAEHADDIEQAGRAATRNNRR